MSFYRAVFFWERDARDLETFANRLAMFLSALRGAEAALSPWVRLDDEGEAQPVVGREATLDALRAAGRPLGEDRMIYDLALHVVATEVEQEEEPEYLGDAAQQAPAVAPPTPGTRAAELFLSWGHAPLGGLRAWLPNRLELRLHAGLGKRGGTRALVERVVRTVAASFAPDWGFVGSEGRPLAPRPLLDDGAPVVGWLTYLGPTYGALPPLPSPAAVHALAQGSLVVASPTTYDERDPSQAAALSAVRQLLDEAGLLVPARVAGTRDDAEPTEAAR